MRSSYTFMRIRGIRISVHFTWLFAVAFIALTLSEGFFPAYFRGWSTATYWGTGILASLLLFLSVLVHELAHSFVAQARGLKVEGITLFIFGGVSNMGSEATRARDEFVIAVVGPLTSLALAALFWALHLVMGDGDGPLAAVVFYLGYMNALLAVFNMMPGFPLDGGRVLRSIVWGVTGNLTRATNIAAGVGQAFGWSLVALGVYQILQGNVAGGLWVAV
ncbi:MAG: site-2 protease family protein, partial [Chloroflexi bacterium]|nr:site-2 protease family protein [Chloroflexota bacterium]